MITNTTDHCCLQCADPCAGFYCPPVPCELPMQLRQQPSANDTKCVGVLVALLMTRSTSFAQRLLSSMRRRVRI
jgi:hypothetical protein